MLPLLGAGVRAGPGSPGPHPPGAERGLGRAVAEALVLALMLCCHHLKILNTF